MQNSIPSSVFKTRVIVGDPRSGEDPHRSVHSSAFFVSLLMSLTPTAVFSPAFSVYLTVSSEPCFMPFPESLVPCHVVFPVHFMVCSTPSWVLTTSFLEPVSTC